MKWSLYTGRVAGIKIFIHWTFLILILGIVFSGIKRGYNAEAILLNLGFIGCIFVCVTLHELGHAITAKRFNFKTRDIILLPIGGLARMEGLPDKPKHEFLVAIMGPAVNIIIALILFLTLKLSDASPESLDDFRITRGNFWFQLYSVNLYLAIFNLIPAFPMDGGRILRALLSIRLPRARATRIAAHIGQFIAIVFVFVGFMYNPVLLFIGLFVFLGAQAEASMEEAKVVLSKVKVKDLIMHHYSVLDPEEPLSKAVTLLLDSQEKSFLVKEGNMIKGVLSKKEIIEGLSKFGKDIPVKQVMQTEFVALHEEDNLGEIMLKFTSEANKLMPVMEGNEIKGVIDLENINEYVEIQNALKWADKA